VKKAAKSPEEEGANISFDTFLARYAKHRLLTKSEELKLIRAAQPRRGRKPGARNRKAFDRLLRHNVLLLMKFVHSYARSAQRVGMELADLFNEAAIGLQKAVEKFDTKSGNRLSTYAGPWIKQSITRAMDDKGLAIRVPVNLQQRRRLIAKIVQRAWSLGQTLTDEEMATRLGISIASMKRSHNGSLTFVSVDRPLTGGTASAANATRSQTYLERMTDAEAALADQEAADLLTRERSEELHAAMLSLTPQERAVIGWRFWEDLTLEQTITAFKPLLTDGATAGKETIRRIEKRALSKLKQAIAHAA